MKIAIAKYEPNRIGGNQITWLAFYCKIDSMSNKVKISCLYCNSEFESYISKNKKYCTTDCFYKSGAARLGKKHSQQTKKKLSEISKKNPRVMATTFKEGHKLWDNPAVKKHWFKKGSIPANYKGGNRSLYQKIKDDTRYSKWRKAVLNRDNYTCQDCGATKGLHCHHIKKSTEHIELAYEPSNGITLCAKCHGLRHRI